MNQSYYLADNAEPFYRPMQRIASVPSLQERHMPYVLYDQRHEDEPLDDRGRRSSRFEIEEQELDAEMPKARRRVPVACARCRKRKIRCSGDPGDNTGCNACKASRIDPSRCTFNRVGCQSVEVLKPDILPSNGASFDRGRSANASASLDYGTRCQQQLVTHRASLPNLPLHFSAKKTEETAYHTQANTYSSHTPVARPPRHDSFGYIYHDVDTPFYSQPGSNPAYHPQGYGCEVVASYPQPISHTQMVRAPSGIIEQQSPMNMGSLHDSLPIATAERRLPVPQPCTWSYPAYQPQQSRAIVGWRPHAGIHDHYSMSWAHGKDNAPPTRHDSLRASYSLLGPPHSTLAHRHSAPNLPEPVLGYQISQAPRYSPNVSPTTESDAAKSFSNDVPAQDSEVDVSRSCQAPTTAGEAGTVTSVDSRRHSAAMYEAGMNLYSFSTTISDHNGVHTVDNYGQRNDFPGPSSYIDISHAGYAQPRHVQASQPMRYTLAEQLQRPASFETHGKEMS